MAESGKYIYAVIDQSADQNYGPIGINGGLVSVISMGQIGAAVSDIADRRIRPERKNMAAHNAVVKRLMEGSTILPVSFGTIASNSSAVRDILKKNKSGFAAQLKRFDGKIEMGLRISLVVPNIFEYMVNSEPELATLRDKLLGGQRVPTHNDQIELGRTFDRLLSEARERYLDSIMAVLTPLTVDIKSNPPRNESEIASLACLVIKSEQQRFEEGIQEAASLFDNNFSFDYNGPWALYNFVDLTLVD